MMTLSSVPLPKSTAFGSVPMPKSTAFGMIPAWQFSRDPYDNPKLTTLDYPQGVYQTTIQPLGPYYRRYKSAPGMSGWFSNPFTATFTVAGAWAVVGWLLHAYAWPVVKRWRHRHA